MYQSESSRGPHFAVRSDWLRQHQEAAIDPDLPIIDAHHHLWTRPESRYAAPDFEADLNTGHGILASVLVECGTAYHRNCPAHLRPVGETEFAAASLVANTKAGGRGSIGTALVAHVDLTLGARVDEVLCAHRAAAGGRLRGVRHIAAWHEDQAARGSLANPPAGLLSCSAFRHGVAALGRAKLPFETFIYHTQLSDLADLAKSVPATIFIVDHVGGPIGIGPYAGRREEVFAAWRCGMRGLSDLPNVHVKLSGLGMRCCGFDFTLRSRPPGSQELARAWSPYILECIELFGVQRCMFGSNFPVDKGSCSYGVLWNVFKLMTRDASSNELDDLFLGTAAKLYCLDMADYTKTNCGTGHAS